MSMLFGSGKKTKPEYQGVQVQTSSNATPLPLVWGLQRLAPNLIWYGDFKAKPVKAGGKGGGGKGAQQYDYSASVEMALCQGPSAGILRCFIDKLKTGTISSLGYTFIDGSDPQSPWSYLASNHADQALSYPGTVILAKANMDLGNSASLPQQGFETKALRYNTQVGGAGDADPSGCIYDLLTLTTGGVGFPASLIDQASLFSGPDAPTTGDSALQTYCQAMGFGLSPALATQETASTVLDRWTKLLNSAMIWTGAQFKFIPFALETITGNGVTYVPPVESTTPQYSLKDSDYISDSTTDPVIVSRRDSTTIMNRLSLEILHRGKEYNPVPIEWVDQGLVDQYGERIDSTFQAHEVCEPTMATVMVSLMGQRNAYRGNNTYKFTLGPEFCLVEPMDCLELVDPILGTILVQVNRTEEDESAQIAFEAYQLLLGSTDSGGFAAPDQTPTGDNWGIDAGSVNTPILLEPSSLLLSTPQVWAAVSGAVPASWGGCFVWVSLDGTSFSEIGEVQSAARMGVTTSALAAYGGTNPDTVDTLGVDLSESLGELIGVAAGDAAKAVTLCYVGGELISFQDATLTSTSHYTLGTALYRGLYGTAPAAHASGVPFARLDDAVFKYDLPIKYIGQTLYFKFQSYNIFGQEVQDISTCAVYTYTPAGTGYGTAAGGSPAAPTGLSLSAGSGYNKLTWTANSGADNIDHYNIYRAVGPAGLFGSAVQIGTASGTTYNDSTAVPGTTYTYFIVAVNQIGAGAPSTGADIAASAPTGIGSAFGFAFMWPNPTASKPVAFFDTPLAWSIPAGMADCQGTIGDSDTAGATAPTAQTDFDIQSPAGTSIGTMRFASGSLTATFIMAATHAIPLGQPVTIIAPASLNGLAGTVYGSIKGSRT